MAAVDIDVELVRCLLREQFPQWAQEPVRQVEPGGWDNRTFRVGDGLAARLPSAAGYVAAVAKEHRWLPVLADQLPVAVPQPVGLGRPGCGFPWPWSLYRWLPGTSVQPALLREPGAMASELAAFVRALHAVDATGGPVAGEHSFGRAGPLARYDDETRTLAASLLTASQARRALALWDAALLAPHEGRSVWVHGDLTGSNLLAQDGHLTAVIDWGTSAVGDPACDLGVAWTLLDPSARDVFATSLQLEAGVWARARGWVLWKALVTLADAAGAATATVRFGWRLAPQQLIDELLSPDRKRGGVRRQPS